MVGYIVLAADGAILYDKLDEKMAIESATRMAQKADEVIYIAKYVYEVSPTKTTLIKPI